MKTEQTKSKPERSQFAYGKVVFIEYSTARKGQHFMAVMVDKKVIARVYREYDPEKKRMIYTARENEGKEVLPPTENLYQLKKHFIENAKQRNQAMQIEERDDERKEKSQQAKQPAKEKEVKQQSKENAKEKTVTKQTAREEELRELREESQARENEIER